MRRLLVLAAVLTVVVTGCGGGGTSTEASGSTTSNGSAPALQQAYVRTVHAVSGAVVQIETDSGLGSGIVFDEDGHVVTNYHVVAGAKSVRVTLADGSRRSGSVAGTFRAGDLAVVAVKGGGVKPAAFADSSTLEVGHIVLALGNPLGLRSSVTNGIVSALGRTVSEPGGVVLTNVIQTSAPINPGNSGGALVDLSGKVVGIPTLAAVDPELGGSAAPGIGFAVPSNTVHDIATQIIQHGHVVDSHRAYLGVQLASGISSPGAVVASVEKGGPADKAGVRSGDVITSVADKHTPSAAALASVLATMDPGKTVKLALNRNGAEQTVEITLGQRPASTG